VTPVRRQTQIYIERPIEVVFGFVTDLKNFSRLALPGQPEEVLTQRTSPLDEGVCITYDGGPFKFRTLEVSELRAPHAFVELQIEGGFAAWTHRRRLTKFQDGTLLTDIIEYELHAGALGALASKIWMGKTVEDWMRHRQNESKRILERIGRIKGPGK
jgi:ligand-binding SRPBCC domain-containing protein